jgi:hypothetical protein
MPSIIRINGRLYTGSRDYRAAHVRAGESAALAANTRRDNLPCDGTPIPADSPDSPFRAGEPYHDEAEDVVYRIVSRINVAEGWGTASFWMQRWHCYYVDLLGFVRKGWLDAAIEEGSAVKRFRCRDELRVRAELDPVLHKRTEQAQAKPAPKGGTPGANRVGFRRYDRQR